MGKGTIISGGTDGQYQVSVQYNVERVQAEKAASLAKIANLNTRIAEETDEQKLNILKLQKMSLEKRNEILDNIPESETISAWCADLTEDLTGDVGLIEVPGESESFNIHPGYGDNAEYDPARDGQLTPTMAMSPASAFYNLAMLPGWQKWKPTYRYGTITTIDGDTADVSLDAATSSQQSLGVNQASTLTDVPVEYMSCNGAAFDVGDEVLVKFTGQDWAVPAVVGFKSNPKECGWIETWNGELIASNHPWFTLRTDGHPFPSLSPSDLCVLGEDAEGNNILVVSHDCGPSESWRSNTVRWDSSYGDSAQPPGLMLKLKCKASVVGSDSFPEDDYESYVTFIVEDKVNGMRVSVVLAYNILPSAGHVIDASSQGSTGEEISIDLSAYGLENPGSLNFFMYSVAFCSYAVFYEWDYVRFLTSE